MVDITDLSIHLGNQGQVSVHGDQYQAVHCLNIPLHQMNALLPNAAVAEPITNRMKLPMDLTGYWVIYNGVIEKYPWFL